MIQHNQENIIELAKEKVRAIEIPSHILKTNQYITVEQQESAYQYVLKNKDNLRKTMFPKKIDYENCLGILNLHFDIYQWDKYENKLKSKNKLKYFALLMNTWINGTSLNEIIN